jgi:hypothetical protein
MESMLGISWKRAEQVLTGSEKGVGGEDRGRSRGEKLLKQCMHI